MIENGHVHVYSIVSNFWTKLGIQLKTISLIYSFPISDEL